MARDGDDERDRRVVVWRGVAAEEAVEYEIGHN